MLDEFPSNEECKDVVNNMKKEKSLLLDGLPSEFYHTFWSEIGFIFYETLKDIYNQREMSSSQKLSVISLVYKKGEKNYLSNYRPISLMNTDYKIIAFVFAKRLQKVLNYLINDNQTGYIKGRFIGVNARLISKISLTSVTLKIVMEYYYFLTLKRLSTPKSGSFYIRH